MTLKAIVSRAANDEQPAVAVTDTANLFGALEFSEAASDAGVQPLVGCTVPLTLPDDLAARRQSGRARLPLIATSETGFANLTELISRAYLESSADCTVSMPLLKRYSEGLVALTGWRDGPLGLPLALDDNRTAEVLFSELRDAFREKLYVEIQRHGAPGEAALERFVVGLAHNYSVPLVATNECYFAERADYEAHDALIAIADGRRLADTTRRRLTSEHYFKSQDEMRALFPDCPEAIANTVEIARLTHARPRKRPPLLPRFVSGGDVAGSKDEAAAEASTLERMAERGLQARLATRGLAPGVDAEAYRKRLAHELQIIVNMKFPGYFLIVADFIQWAKAQGIAVGPGRGSGAGSLVAYALTITDLDPLRFDLLFERFLNPERVSMPDFDIDFCQERRDEVIHYVQNKYGADKVAQIITFGTLQARAVVRDVGRVLDMSYGRVDSLAKLVPANPANPVTLAKALETEPRLQEVRARDPEVAQLLGIAQKLEGLTRHASTHAAGIVIGDKPLEMIVPLYRDPRSDLPVTQYNMKWVESAGLVKFDFLGLKTLTTIERALAQIASPPDMDTLPLDNEAAFALLAKGETAGVFQLESAGMRKALVGMRPDRFEDIIAIVALYRPGPMDNIPAYNRRKHGLEAPDYLHPKLEPILKETYGIIIYQEQVMQIAQVLSGYSLGEADLLRRAMGKKIASEMAVQRDRFVDGAMARGIAANDANHIFDLVAKFANYGFNKSHAAAYALIAYQTAYLKANYTKEFIAASMTLDMGNTEKLNDFRAEAQRLGITVAQPCINQSEAEFRVEGDVIRYGLAAIKGVGRPLVDGIVAARATKPFTSLADFSARLDPKTAPRRGLEALIAAGALDCFGVERGTLTAALDQVLGIAGRVSSGAAMGQSDFFGITHRDEIRLPKNANWPPAERLQKEHDAIGFYLSSHPLDDYAERLASLNVPAWRDYADAVRRGEGFRLAGVVVSRQERSTRNGGRLAIVVLSDLSGQYEGVAFSDLLEIQRDRLEPGTCVLLSVQPQEREEGLSVRINNVELLDELQSDFGTLSVFVDDQAALVAVERLLSDPGGTRVELIARLQDCQGEAIVRLAEGRHVPKSVAAAIRDVAGVREARLKSSKPVRSAFAA